MTHYVLPGAAFRHSHSHRAWDLCVFSGKLLRGVFPKNCCQFQLVISSTQYLLHAWHHQHHLHQLHVHRIHHLHHLHQLQWTSSTSYTHTHLIHITHHVIYTGVVAQEFDTQDFLYRSSFTGVLIQEFLHRSSTQEVLRSSCYTGVLSSSTGVLTLEFFYRSYFNQGWKEPRRLEGTKAGRREGRKEGERKEGRNGRGIKRNE